MKEDLEKVRELLLGEIERIAMIERGIPLDSDGLHLMLCQIKDLNEAIYLIEGVLYRKYRSQRKNKSTSH